MEPVQEQAARKASSSSFSFSYFSIDFTDVHKEATQSGNEYKVSSIQSIQKTLIDEYKDGVLLLLS